MKVKLMESKDLYKGIFWIVDQDNLDANKKYCFTIECTPDGNSTGLYGDHVAKSGDTYNHKKYWGLLPKEYTHNKPFDYYPRGRVEISNGKATIYLNPNIATKEIMDFLVDQFNLNEHNGIKKARLFPDGSSHYKCHLDY